jgi:formylglycine-generating enzyme required for sulfatase activity
MRIFLSYASQDAEQAKDIYVALRDQGHKVFFDRTDLPAGDEYHNRIRAAIEKSHLFVFLISPNAIDAGSYTLTELDIADKSRIKLLPVMFEKTAVEKLPATIKGITFLESDGNLPAAVAAEVHRIAAALRLKWLKYCSAGLIFGLIVFGVVFYALKTRVRTEVTGKDGALAVLIPAGAFVMGDDENSPRRQIYLDAFYMDKFEVTVARYAKFLQATGNVGQPDEWDTADVARGGELPVVGVNWQDASSYCRWAGKRLPTEAEWEKAARGNDERKYPWGNNAPMPEYARYGKRYENPVYKDGVAPVGSHAKDVSPFGIFDLAGNVTEWVADWYSESFPADVVRNPKGPDSGTTRVLRGGSWYEAATRIQVTKRWFSTPYERNDGFGFRCASDIK